MTLYRIVTHVEATSTVAAVNALAGADNPAVKALVVEGEVVADAPAE